MVVMLIIGVLASIIMPALGNARDLARATNTIGLFHAIDIGIESFHDDQILGNDDYPPSTWDTAARGNPYPAGGPDYYAPGAETLLWALTGADHLGSPGFGGNLNPTNGLYELTLAGQPVHPRVTFIDPSEAEIAQVPADASGSRDATVYLDAFKSPVLYYRANPSPPAAPLDIYNRDHNQGVILGRANHPQALSTDLPGGTTFNGVPVTEAFEVFTGNPGIPTPNLYRPHKQDSYILISSGSDKSFGTDDDVTNYPLTGKNY